MDIPSQDEDKGSQNKLLVIQLQTYLAPKLIFKQDFDRSKQTDSNTKTGTAKAHVCCKICFICLI